MTIKTALLTQENAIAINHIYDIYWNIKGKEPTNRYCLWIDYIFTFLAYLIEIVLQRRYKGLFIVQAMSTSGNKWIKK
jgi:hypothetical protein